MTRYKKYIKVKEKYNTVSEQLKNRKVIEKAKGILMEKENIKESEAYDKLRIISMNKGKSLIDISNMIVLNSKE